MLTLSQIEKGTTARIVDILGEDGIAIRLMEMGLIEGEPVTYIDAAPLGDPLEFAVRGYRLTLRRREADRVQVELDSAS
jgi:ferrous iron transport protein A